MLESLLRATATLLQSLEPGQPLCVLAARLMHDWLDRRGIENAVLPCRVTLWNEALLEREANFVSIGYGYPDDRQARFGYHPARGSYNGHLVVRVDDLILDPTLGQASDHTRGIVAGPLLARVQPPAFFAGITEFADVFRWGVNAPLRVAYAAEPTDLSYRRTYHWNDPYRAQLLKLLESYDNARAS
jgi:hypothetical protein